MGFVKREATIRKVTAEATRTGDKKETDKGIIPLDKLKYRINPKPRPIKRYKTGITTFDIWTGGLPYGLSVFTGHAGSGKSLLARKIASLSKRALYFTCEVNSDAPLHSQYPNVDTIDYTEYRVGYQKALAELDSFVYHLKPDLVVIDSLTSFLSITKKALPESDLRASISNIHIKYDGIVPIIGISEIRGTGFNETTAGGRGVEHANSLLIKLDCFTIVYPSQIDTFGGEMGDDIYTLKVMKDKFNVSQTKLARVTLRDGDIIVEDAKSGRTPEKKKSIWQT